MQRTVQVILNPSTEQRLALAETTAQFTATFNLICAEGWRLREGNAYTLHRLTYRKAKATYPVLVSDLHVQARQKASETLKSAITHEKKGPPRYNLHTVRIYWDRGYLTLSTTAGRLKVPFCLPEYAAFAAGLPAATADLICKRGKWRLNLVVKVPDVPFEDTGKAIGVDLGVTHPAVTSDGRFLGKRHWREVEKRTLRLRRSLQSKGTKSAKRHLRSLAGRTQRFRRDCDHVLSASLLKGIESGATIVVENLTNIRKRVKASSGEAKRRLHSWSFAQLRGFLEYKAEALGCRVIAVDPRHTSQRCYACGFTYKGNRRSRSEFLCRRCGHRQNSDLNASLNIRDKHLVGWASGPSSGPPPTGLSSRPSG